MITEKITMRIVYLHQYYNTPAMSGGTRSYEMARRWSAAGHDVHVVTSSREARHRREWRQTIEDGVTVHWCTVPYDNAMSFADRIRAFVRFSTLASRKTLQLRPDVIFATSTPLTIIIPAAIGKLLRRAPLVFEVRDLWPELPIATGYLKNPVLKMAARALESFSYRVSAQVVALSPGMADGVAKAGVARERITIAPNACDIERFDVDAAIGQQYRDQQPWLGDRPLVVYCGTLGWINGVGYLARVAAAMASINPDVAFAVYGSGRDHESVRALANELGVLERNFFMMGRVAKSEMPAILSAATVATSLFLPIPEMCANSANKFFDALAAGRPVAINYGGWQAGLLAHSGAGIVLDPTDPHRSALDLQAIITDTGRLGLARQAARNLAREKFSRDVISSRVLAAVESALGPAPLTAAGGGDRTLPMDQTAIQDSKAGSS